MKGGSKMKRLALFTTLVVVLLLMASTAAQAQKGAMLYTLYLHASNNTGVTTVASGTSTMIVEGFNHTRSVGDTVINRLDLLDLGTCVIQLQEADVSQGVKGDASGNYSGATFTLRYRESAISGSAHQGKAATTDLYTGMALSGNSLYQVEFYPVGMGNIDFQFITGATPFDRAVFKLYLLQ